MIYCVSPDIYPKGDQVLEEITYNDQNGFDWKIARVLNGFFIRYFGPEYFAEEIFIVELNNGDEVRIKNTRCIFWQSNSFDDFCNWRDILREEYTDDIWDSIHDALKERFLHSGGLLESEII